METSIQFADDTHNITKVQSFGGVVPLRQRSRSYAGRRSVDVDKVTESGDIGDEDAGLRDERDYKKKQVRKIFFRKPRMH